MHLRIILATTLVAGTSAAGLAQQPALSRIDSVVSAVMTRQRIPGVAVAIVKGGSVMLAKGYGESNVEHHVPVTAETMFQSGSVGKQFTSAAVMLLVEDGKIALTDPIVKFFPNAPASWKGITVRHLLTHTSGIPDYTTDAMDYRRDYTEDELEKMAFGLTPEFPPGSRWNYSNTGYVLLGIIIHKASGKFYGDVLRERVFGPLGMRTARIINEEDIIPNRAAGYRMVRGELKNQEWVAPKLNTTADGSLYLSVQDYIAWDRGLREKKILKPESWATINTPVTLTSGKRYPYGFGWSVDTVAGQLRIHHGGAWQGFQTYISRYIGDDVTIVALSNLGASQPGVIVDGIAAVLNPALAPKPLAPITDNEPAVRKRLEAILAATRDGRLSPNDFAYVRAGFFPGTARAFQEALAGTGVPDTFTLYERIERGDDRIYTYDVGFGARTFRVTLGLAPDDKVSMFSLRRP
ncbi:MAG TPA: serine hydrolase domain-containing protein [Gemmatimonadaceae bacterium]|nr:serine hydrolase domain-containing protein [Gemmatimonadaceae bacterium]